MFQTIDFTPRFQWQAETVARLRAEMSSDEDSYTLDGVRHWRSNDAIIPPHVFKDAFLVCPKAQQDAYDKDLAAFVKAYRKRQPRRPSAEERFEARAAFGPGVQVVDVFSGRKFTT